MRQVILLVISAFFCAGQVNSQAPVMDKDLISIYNETMSKYEIDPLVQNGIYYENPYHKAEGHQFFIDGDFHVGSLIYRNKSYDGIRLKYDIFEQAVIVNQDKENPTQVNLLANELVSQFSISGINFKKILLEDGDPQYYQVLYESEEISCYYYWTKSRSELHEGTFMRYQFSDKKNKAFLLIGGEIFRYRSNRSFVKKFPEPVRKQVRQNLKSNKIKVEDSDIYTIGEVLQFCKIALEQYHEQVQF